MNPKISFPLAALLALAPGLCALDLDAYLGQVRSGSPALAGARAEDAALALSAKRPLTAFSPTLNGQVSYDDNQELPLGDTQLSPVDTQELSWDASLSQFFSTGTKVGLDYSGDKANLLFPGVVSQFASNPAFAGFLPYFFTYGQQWDVSVSQSLWRDLGAAQESAALDKAQADADAGRAANAYRAQAVLLEARQAYIGLATDRRVEARLRDAMARASAVLAWTKGKQADNLADRADVLESQAALVGDRLELRRSLEDEASALADFNVLRGSPPQAPVGDLAPFPVPTKLPVARPGARLDVVQAEAALRSARAEVRSVRRSFTPDVSLFAEVGGAEQNPQYLEPGLGGGFRPQTMVGLKFSADLDYLLYRQIVAGARKAEGYGRSAIRDRTLAAQRDWAALESDFAGTLDRLGLAREVEALDRERAAREDTLYRDGRTTHFEVLKAQSDYDNARIEVLRLEAEAASLGARARYYAGEDRPW